jgi:hypothetical protein
MTRPWSPVQVKQLSKHDSKKPRDQAREDEKLWGPSQKSVESCGTRSFIQSREKLVTRATCRRGKDLEDSGTDTWQSRSSAGPKWAQASWSRPFPSPVDPCPFDLAAIRTIYSPEAKSHRSTHLSSAAEEQRREGLHLGEERVELVD